MQAAPKRRAGGTNFLFSGFSISLKFINAPFYHAFTAFLSQEGQEGQEGQDFFQKCEKHWEIEGFLRAGTNKPAKPRGPMARGLKPELQVLVVYLKIGSFRIKEVNSLALVPGKRGRMTNDQ